MTEQTNTHQDFTQDEDEISLLDLATVIVENLKLLILGPLAAGLLALGISFLITPTFTAKTTILPPVSSGSSNLLGALGGLGDIAGAAAGLKNPSEQFVAYLKSDSLQNSLIADFDLQKRYDQEYLVNTRKALEGKVKVTAQKQSGLISIEVDDEDPAFAAKLANAHVSKLQELVGRVAAQEAKDRREFMESQVDEAMKKNYQSPMVREIIIQGLIRSYETARIDEQKAGPTFSQVDVAIEPELKSKPKKALIAVITTLAVGFLLLLFVFIRKALQNADNDPESKEKINKLKVLLKGQFNLRSFNLK
jgi:capsular polysaccharide biosynthesis protein